VTSQQRLARSAVLKEEGCSDVLVNFGCHHGASAGVEGGEAWAQFGAGGACQQLLAHNEDVGQDAVGHLYFVRASSPSKV